VQDSGDCDLIKTVERELASLDGARVVPEGSDASLWREMNGYRDLLGRSFEQAAAVHARGASGIRVCRLLTGIIDRFVIHSFRTCFPEHQTAGTAVFALGGYGRSELSPYSDVDLLFLMDARTEGSEDSRISSMLRFLWDLNLDIGHSTRTVGECIQVADEDSYLATSLLEARFLAGNEPLRDEFMKRYSAWLQDGAARRIAGQKIEERLIRIESFNGTVQIQTPNIKDSPGGLRDIHISRWLAALSEGKGEIGALPGMGYLNPEETASYGNTLDFLLRVRNALHFVSRKKSDLLNHLILPELASNLGYSGENIHPVECLMHDYYLRAGVVFRLTNRVIERYIERFQPNRRKPLAVLPIGLRANDTHVSLLHEREDFLDEHPHLAVEIFTVAGACNLQPTENSASVIERWAARRDETFSEIPEVQTAFHELLNMRSGVSAAIRLLHAHGVLTRLIPEFGAITWHYQYDFYHAFTTDEHSIRVVENLEHMASGKFAPFPELHEIMADVTAKGALYLAGILHDIGKAEEGSHSAHGERLAIRAMRRLRFDDRTTDLVRFLIREHLLMSHTSQRRDMDDPDTFRGFIERVRSTGRLRMLTALTFADLAALSSGALTDWKKSLLWGLYTRAHLLIEKGYEHTVSLREVDIERIIQKLRKTVSEESAREHIGRLPEQYLLVTPLSRMKEHIDGIGYMESHGMWVSFHSRKGLTYLTVICRDYPRALSDICGTITASDINIVAAQVFTRSDGIIIDTFVVVSGSGESAIPPESRQAFRENFGRVISGEFNTKDLIRSHALRWKRRKRNVVYYPPRVRADNSVSTRYTVLDVFATDYTGLLYDITSVLAENDIDIHTARIGTDEDQVADAFYIRKRGGGKVEGEELEKLKKEVIERIAKGNRNE
jgi:[protein-PII] uridylyltransferase